MKTRIPMTDGLQKDLILSLALAGGWIVRAIEEYGVGGDHKPDTNEFIGASQMVLSRIGEQLQRLGAVPEGGPYSVNDVIRKVITEHTGEARP